MTMNTGSLKTAFYKWSKLKMAMSLAELQAEYQRIVNSGSAPYQALCQLEPEMGNYDSSDIMGESDDDWDEDDDYV